MNIVKQMWFITVWNVKGNISALSDNHVIMLNKQADLYISKVNRRIRKPKK